MKAKSGGSVAAGVQSAVEVGSDGLVSDVIERGAWRSVASGWKQLHGSFSLSGVSIESHAFHVAQEIDWGRSFHPGSLELCLNQSGCGEVRARQQTASYRDQTVGFYGMGKEGLSAVRAAGQSHAFVTVECSRDYLAVQISGYESLLAMGLRHWLDGRKSGGVVGEVRELTASLQHFVEMLRHPPVSVAIRRLWYQSKITELLALTLFQVPPVEKLRNRRVQLIARERAERVLELLRSDLCEPPDLEAMGRAIGCSPFYLSRTFSRVMGKTIPQQLRELRIRRAAELLREGRHNVTEAAIEVGYTSLSHFSTAFCQITGCCPSLYPHSRHLINPGF